MEILINLIQGIGIVFFEIICCKNFFLLFLKKGRISLYGKKFHCPCYLF